jgi:hypothetical protein
MQSDIWLVISIIWLGYATYSVWSFDNSSEEYRQETIKNHPFLHEWYLSKGFLWLSRIVATILLLIYLWRGLQRLIVYWVIE